MYNYKKELSSVNNNNYYDFIGNKSYKDLLNKPPEIDDLFSLLRCSMPASWNLLGIQLNVPFSDRESLWKDTMTDVEKLEIVLQKWNSTQSSSTTWKTIINALVNCQQTIIAAEVQTHLEKPEVYDKYINKSDFVPFNK